MKFIRRKSVTELSYLDQATISIVSTDLDPDEGEELFRVVLGVTDKAVVKELVNSLIEADYGGSLLPPYHLEHREFSTEWGASAATVEIILSISSDAALAAVGYLARGLLSRKKRTKALSESDAIEAAKQQVANQYAIEIESLSTKQYKRLRGINVVVLQSQGDEYTEELYETKKGYGAVATIAWKYL